MNRTKFILSVLLLVAGCHSVKKDFNGQSHAKAQWNIGSIETTMKKEDNLAVSAALNEYKNDELVIDVIFKNMTGSKLLLDVAENDLCFVNYKEMKDNKLIAIYDNRGMPSKKETASPLIGTRKKRGYIIVENIDKSDGIDGSEAALGTYIKSIKYNFRNRSCVDMDNINKLGNTAVLKIKQHISGYDRDWNEYQNSYEILIKMHR